MTTPGGYALTPEELRRLKGTLSEASTRLGMKDFAEATSLEGGLTTQSVSRYEDVESTVEESILKLTEVVDRHYPAVVESMQDFIDRVHLAIDTGVDDVQQTLTTYVESEQTAEEQLPESYPN